MRDDTTAGYTNHFSAITAGGMDASDTKGTNYGVAHVPNDWQGGTYDMLSVECTLDTPALISGFYVTNSTYAYLSMRDGDMLAKKFGGQTGNDPDYLKLLIWGTKENGSFTDTIDFYLADYRFEDNSEDYIIDNWRWVDLLKLGKVKKILFSLESSDVSAWGMNTPAYFCIDNLTVIPAEIKVNVPASSDYTFTEKMKVYPNPFNNEITILCNEGSIIYVYDMSGRIVMEEKADNNAVTLLTGWLNKGYYIVKITGKTGVHSFKVIKQ